MDHLTDESTSFLAINFLNFLNNFHEKDNLQDWQPNLSKSMNPKPETKKEKVHLKGRLSYIMVVFLDLRW